MPTSWRQLPIVALLLLAVAPAEAQEARRPRPITRTVRVPDQLRGMLPSREDCERAVRRVAEHYQPGELGEVLHERFPQRAELLDALNRLAIDASWIRLDVESVENLRILPQAVTSREGADGESYEVLLSDCEADVRTRLSLDDAGSGQRRVLAVERALWRIRFEPGDGAEDAGSDEADEVDGPGQDAFAFVPAPSGPDARHGRVVLRVYWRVPESLHQRLREGRDEVEQHGLRIDEAGDGLTLVWPDLPAAGWLVRQGEQLVITDVEGRFVLAPAGPDAGSLQVLRPGDPEPVGVFEPSLLTASAANGEPLLVELLHRGPCGMTSGVDVPGCHAGGD